MLTKIYDLAFEVEGENIQLEQDAGCGEVNRITLHRTQVALLAEQMGVVRAPLDAEAAQTIATMTRRLNVLRDRIDHMAHWLANHSDSRHADLSYEQTYATATADIANEFCHDLPTVLAPVANHLPLAMRDGELMAHPMGPGVSKG